MSQPLEAEIRQWLARYVTGEISLSALTAWLVPTTWNIHQFGSQSAQELTYEIEHRVAEYTNGHRTQEELKDLLRSLLTEYRVAFDLTSENSDTTTRTTFSSDVTYADASFSNSAITFRASPAGR